MRESLAFMLCQIANSALHALTVRLFDPAFAKIALVQRCTFLRNAFSTARCSGFDVRKAERLLQTGEIFTNIEVFEYDADILWEASLSSLSDTPDSDLKAPPATSAPADSKYLAAAQKIVAEAGTEQANVLETFAVLRMVLNNIKADPAERKFRRLALNKVCIRFVSL